jgi:hypothetical protein
MAAVVVIVRFLPGLGVPYEDGIEGRLSALLGPKWRPVADEFPNITFNRVFADPPTATPNRPADPEEEHYFQVPFGDERTANRFVDRLQRLRGTLVAEVYLEGQPAPPGMPVGEETERRVSLREQGYFGRAPHGIDALAAWRRFAAFGAGVSVGDVEEGWDFGHPDLPPDLHQICGLNDHQFDHGTADLGILVARHDSPEIRGGAPQVRVLPASYVRSKELSGSVAWAIDQASQVLNAGDILLLEVVYQNSGYETPAEMKSNIRAAIHRCTRRDVLVIEPAGAGGRNLASFDLEANRTAALMVSAAHHEDGDDARHWAVSGGAQDFNYGERVNCFAWGNAIKTLRAKDPTTPGPRGELYLNHKGTSGAAAIIAAAAALLQSFARPRLARIGRNPPHLQVDEMLDYLGDRDTGTLNEDHADHPIGVMPDLYRVMERVRRDFPDPTDPPGPGRRDERAVTPKYKAAKKGDAELHRKVPRRRVAAQKDETPRKEGAALRAKPKQKRTAERKRKEEPVRLAPKKR